MIEATAKAEKRRTSRKRAKPCQKKRQLALLLKSFGPWCHLCGAPFTDDNRPTLDHIIPVSQGGLNHVHNIRLACAPCNSRRGDNAAY
jgi:5-methylcytosine-specific restriction endonuclease McrA